MLDCMCCLCGYCTNFVFFVDLDALSLRLGVMIFDFFLTQNLENARQNQW